LLISGYMVLCVDCWHHMIDDSNMAMSQSGITI
jgi:hypothetical protein